MASPAPPIAEPQAPASLATLTDELLEEIFLLLETPTDLARASTACASFRRIITGRYFLRRFRAIHPPPLLGFAAYEGFHPAQPRHSSAPLGDALTRAADFSYSFVPTGSWNTPWHPRDVRQGRVLLECTPECDPAFEFYDVVFLRDLELAVCDPLSRRYVLLPPVRDELRAEHEPLFNFGLFFAPTSEDEETTFRVVCMACNKAMLVAFVFSSITGQWHIPAYFSWNSLGNVTPYSRYSSSYLDYEQGCFYWMVPWRDKLLVVDALNLEVSIVNKNLTGYHMRDSGQPLILAGRDGTPEVFFLTDFFGDGPTDVVRITKQNDGGSLDEWNFENTISLLSQYKFFTLGAAEGLLFLRGVLQDQNSGYSSEESLDNSAHYSAKYPDVEYFSLNVKTSELKRVCGMKRYFHSVYAYFGFPPPLAKPSICSGINVLAFGASFWSFIWCLRGGMEDSHAGAAFLLEGCTRALVIWYSPKISYPAV
uniref:F-box domain-containing protein n=1 Tax=Arundo donax TaxID=35708 RepID=A0A0A9BI22_ARUDO